MIRIIPKKGLKVINPDTLKRVPKEGIVIPKLNTYWKRREQDKDITAVKIGIKTKVASKKEENK